MFMGQGHYTIDNWGTVSILHETVCHVGPAALSAMFSWRDLAFDLFRVMDPLENLVKVTDCTL